jgi:hypothetical protein
MQDLRSEAAHHDRDGARARRFTAQLLAEQRSQSHNKKFLRLLTDIF